jgi:hypothetical protein
VIPNLPSYHKYVETAQMFDVVPISNTAEGRTSLYYVINVHGHSAIKIVIVKAYCVGRFTLHFQQHECSEEYKMCNILQNFSISYTGKIIASNKKQFLT